MNLGINSSMNNYNAINCKRNANPNFGMAVKVDSSANKIIKEQVLKMNNSERTTFFKKMKDMISRQQENPVNIIIKKADNANKLSAEVVDSQVKTALENKTFSQGVLKRNGDLKFADKAEEYANTLNEVNKNVECLPKVGITDAVPGSRVIETGRIFESIH